MEKEKEKEKKKEKKKEKGHSIAGNTRQFNRQIARSDVSGVVMLRWEGGAPKPCQVLWIRPGPT